VARIRRFDGSKIYNESWDSLTRDVLFYLMGVLADNYGLFPAGLAGIAEKLGIDAHAVQDRLDILIETQVLIPYEDDGRHFYAFRRWQDYQHVKYPGMPACPIPPDNILPNLSTASREALLSIRGKLSGASGKKSPRAVVVVVDTGIPAANASGVSPVKTGVDYFYQRLQKHLGLERPVFPFGRAGRFLRERVEAANDTAEDFRDVMDWFFDKRIRGDHSSANWSLFESAYNAGCLAVDRERKRRENHPKGK
jgi:hypothetical protein